jgi:hypothetical protein
MEGERFAAILNLMGGVAASSGAISKSRLLAEGISGTGSSLLRSLTRSVLAFRAREVVIMQTDTTFYISGGWSGSQAAVSFFKPSPNPRRALPNSS